MNKLIRLSLGVCSCYRFIHGARNGGRTKLLPPKQNSSWEYRSWNGGFSPKRTYCNNSTAVVDLLQQESIQIYLRGLVTEYHHITQRLENELLDDSERRVLNRRHVDLLPLVTAVQNTEDAVKDLKEVEALLRSRLRRVLDYKVITQHSYSEMVRCSIG